MNELLFVFIGGGTGSVVRFITSQIWQHMILHPKYQGILFPWPTLLVNIIGCLLISIFYQYSEQWGLSNETRLMLTTGFCGGLTTFSTFSYESLSLLKSGLYTYFMLYILISITLGIIAAAIPFITTHN